MAGPKLTITVGANVGNAVAGLQQLGEAGEHAFDEIAAGAAAMDRITSAIGKMVGEALSGAQAFDKFAASTVKAITPIDTLEKRLDEISTAIRQAGTVQSAANLTAQYEILNRTLEETKREIDQAASAAIGLGRAFNTVATASGALNRLSPAIRPALTDLKLVPPAANAAAASLARLRSSTGQAGAVITDFGRVLQDLPFGFVSIQNNLTQLPESFKRLREATGSTGGALKSLAGSLLGAGGIGFLLSAVTAAATFASVGFGAWTRILGKNSKEADEAAEKTKKLLESLKSVGEVTGEATAGVQGQLVQVRALASVVTDTNRAYSERKRAIEELKQVNKTYFGDLKLESLTTEQLTEKVNEYTKALVNQAVVKGFTDELGRVSLELFKAGQETEKARANLRKLEDQLKRTSRTSANAQGVISQSKAYQDLVNQIVAAPAAINKLADTEKKLATNRDQLTAALNKATIEGLKFLDVDKKTTTEHQKQDEVLKALRKELSGYEKQLAVINELRKRGALPISEENDALALQLKIFETLQKIDAREVEVKVKPDLDIDPRIMELQIQEAIRESGTRSGSGIEVPLIIRPRPLFSREFSPADVIVPNGIADGAFDNVINAIRSNSAQRQEAITEELRSVIVDSLTAGVVDAFVSVGDTLGAAVAGLFSGNVSQALAAGAQTLLSGIGTVLQEVGKHLIATSTLIVKLKAALSSLFKNPVAGIAVGLGLVALGGLLKNIKFPAFADGISSFAGGLALVGERGPEVVRIPAGASVINNNQLQFGRQQEVVVTGVIRGRDIFLTNQIAAETNRRI